MEKCCCGFGHRVIFEPIDDRLDELVNEAIDFGCTTFYVTENGEFDSKFYSAIYRAKRKYKNIKIVLVPYKITQRMNKEKEYYEDLYDEIIIPSILADVYYKQIITIRNRWMIDNSSVVIGYTYRNSGGAYNSINYAKRQNKKVLMVRL